MIQIAVCDDEKYYRDKIREQSMMKALDLVRLCILDHEASR